METNNIELGGTTPSTNTEHTCVSHHVGEGEGEGEGDDGDDDNDDEDEDDDVLNYLGNNPQT